MANIVDSIKKIFDNKPNCDTIFEIHDNNMEIYYVEVIKNGKKPEEIAGEKNEMRESLHLATKFLIDKIPFSWNEGYTLHLLETDDVKKRDPYQYKFCVNREQIVIYCLTREIRGFSMWSGHKLCSFKTFDQVIETVIYQVAVDQLQKLAPECRYKQISIPFDSNSENWNLRTYVRCLPFFGCSVYLDNVRFQPNTNFLEVDFDLSPSFNGPNLEFIDKTEHDNSPTTFKYRFTNKVLTEKTLSLL